MEIMIILILLVLILAGACLFLLWRLRLKEQEIYGYTEKLERDLSVLLSGGELPAPGIGKDTLQDKINDRLYRLSKVSRRKNEEMRQERNQIKELICDISHQTKTPMANITLYLEILQKESEKNAAGFLEKMSGQVRKLDFLMQSMVKLSRLDTGVINVHPVSALVIDTLAAAAADIVPKADRKHITLSVDCDEKLMLCHDKKWSAEALANLLDNAVKYTEWGGSIRICVREREIFTEISVKDSGKGIAPERQAEIFTRFYREPEVHDSEGIGVGLYLSRKIVTMQGGYIQVVSEAGKGADFRVYLPRS